MPAQEDFEVPTQAPIEVKVATYQKATVEVICWIIENSKYPVTKYPGPDGKVYASMLALIKAANDIGNRKICAPTNIRTTLTTVIRFRDEVTARYRQQEGSNVSQSTLGHEYFTTNLRQIQGMLEAVPMPVPLPPKSLIPTSHQENPGIAALQSSFGTLTMASESRYDDQGNGHGLPRIGFQGDDLLQEMIIATWIMQIAHVLQQAIRAYKDKATTAGDFAEAAWVVSGACFLARALCHLVRTKTGLNAKDLLKIVARLENEGKVEGLQLLRLLPIHKLVDQFINTTVPYLEDLDKNENILLGNPELLDSLGDPGHSMSHTLSVLKKVVPDILLQYQDVPDDAQGQRHFPEPWRHLPLMESLMDFGNSRYDAPKKVPDYALFATIEFIFLFHTSSMAAQVSGRKSLDNAFQQGIAFTSSVEQFIDSVPPLVKSHFEPKLMKDLDEIHRLGVILREFNQSTATGLPWTVGIQVHCVLGALNTVTVAMIHQRRVVAAVIHAYNALKRTDPDFRAVPIIDAIMRILPAELFPGSAPPTVDFLNAFKEYSNDRPLRDTNMVWKQSGSVKEHYGPSVVHRYPHPFEFEKEEKGEEKKAGQEKVEEQKADQEDDYAEFTEFLQILRDTSPNSASCHRYKTGQSCR